MRFFGRLILSAAIGAALAFGAKEKFGWPFEPTFYVLAVIAAIPIVIVFPFRRWRKRRALRKEEKRLAKEALERAKNAGIEWEDYQAKAKQAGELPTVEAPPELLDAGARAYYYEQVVMGNRGDTPHKSENCMAFLRVCPQIFFTTNTVFNPYPASITNAVASRLEIDSHLTMGIPSLSPPTGRTDLSDVNIPSFDMNSPQFMVNTWPRPVDGALGGRFLHSDIKNVAYFFTHPVFRKIVEIGGLNE